jgi:hypothetical protein
MSKSRRTACLVAMVFFNAARDCERGALGVTGINKTTDAVTLTYEL